MAGRAALELKSVGKRFADTDVLSDIDLSVELGESVFVTRMSAWASSLRKVMK